jgi:hypothetical protein
VGLSKPPPRNSRDALLGMLRQQATYVQLKCNNNPELLLSSGFEAQSTNRASVPLEKPSDLSVKNGIAGQLDARVRPVKNTNTYEGRCKLDGGDWLPSVFSTDSRHILFNGLTPGKMYTIEIRSLGGSTGQSDWSDPSIGPQIYVRCVERSRVQSPGRGPRFLIQIGFCRRSAVLVGLLLVPIG